MRIMYPYSQSPLPFYTRPLHSTFHIDDANAAIQMASRISHAISEMNLVE